MRRPIFRGGADEARVLFSEMPTFELASTNAAGEPLLRTLHGIVVGDRLAFHAAPIGEKMEIVGRPAVAAVSRTIARVPSYFTDAERACPATTLYVSAQAHGTVVEVTDPVEKAGALEGLMQKLQPEGGYVPIEAAHPLYKKAVAGLAVLAMPLDRVDCKAKLLQHKTPETRRQILEALWRRGAPGDAEAIEALLAHAEGDPPPPFLSAPTGDTLAIALGRGDAEAAASLVAGLYWNDDVTPAEIADAHRGSTAWVGARDASGALVATARALSDGAKHAWIYDVGVRADRRGQGLGEAVVRLLLDHPGVRRARKIHLGTRDAMTFYERLGFVRQSTIARPYVSTEMALLRGSPSAPADVREVTSLSRAGR